MLGGGTMGSGIAHVCAVAGHDVGLQDIEQGVLDDAVETIRTNLEAGVERDIVDEETAAAARSRISTTTDPVEATTAADLVIEAVPERLDLKRDLFEQVEDTVPRETVLATNTSSISVTEIFGGLDHPGRALGLHFANPVHKMDIVEIVEAEQTDAETVAFAEEFVDDLGKTSVLVRDFPGFATSRLGVTLGAEAMRMVQQGVASPSAIDTAMRHTYNHPMGPLELSDHVGLDVRLDILEYLRAELGERFRPPQLLKRKVAAGDLGRKTGRGFYRWEDGDPEPLDGP